MTTMLPTSVSPMVSPDSSASSNEAEERCTDDEPINEIMYEGDSPGKYAQRQLRLARLQSQLRPVQPVALVPWESINIQQKLGVGAFCQVYSTTIEGTKQPQQLWAIKALRPSTFGGSARHVEMAAADLTMEAFLLSRLDHPNIIRLHGVSTGPSLDHAFHGPSGYFLILELLESTLTQKFARWRTVSSNGTQSRSSNSSRRIRSILSSPFSASSTLSSACMTSKQQILHRIRTVALGVALAMEYLHFKNTVLRDLKPCNIGFDGQGNVKLFDFGFAREVQYCPQHETAGSLRYMAPETVQKRHVTVKVDVYSFGVLLYELCTLERPFTQFKTPTAFREKVAGQEWRPSLRSIRSGTLRRLISACWDGTPQKRPTFVHIASALIDVIRKHDEDFDVPTSRPRSDRSKRTVGCALRVQSANSGAGPGSDSSAAGGKCTTVPPMQKMLSASDTTVSATTTTETEDPEDGCAGSSGTALRSP